MVSNKRLFKKDGPFRTILPAVALIAGYFRFLDSELLKTAPKPMDVAGNNGCFADTDIDLKLKKEMEVFK